MPLADCARKHHARASLILRLRETEDYRPVGITKVVSDADLLNYVALAADIVACDPCSCDRGSSLAAFQPAVADMQARLEQSVVWLAPAGETASAFSALEPCVGSPARHPWSVSNKCPIYGREHPKTSMHRDGRFSSLFKRF